MMIADLGPTAGDKGKVYVRRHVKLSSCPVKTACLDTVI